MRKRILLSIILISSVLFQSEAKNYLIETENFANKGGWVIDQQFMDEMGSPFLLAHGLGKPVSDAETTVKLEKGNYQVWVRTRDWVATWGTKGAPGKFNILINNKPLRTVFGTKGAEWFWENGGTVEISGSPTKISLHDLTGFEGRCDALFLTTDSKIVPPSELKEQTIWRRKLLGTQKATNAGSYDFVIVGGGMAGVSAALTAARLGLKVAIVQDRPVMGGNSSSEVRVWPEGALNAKPYVNLGSVTKEISPTIKNRGNADLFGERYADSLKTNALSKEKNITVFLNYRANEVSAKGKNIQSITAQNIETGKRIQLKGTYFADCTGDATIGFLAGADYEITLDNHMGASNLWVVKEMETPVTFPRCPWALDLSDKPFPGRKGEVGAYNKKGTAALGEWFWESGFNLHPFTQAEINRDWNFRAMYGAWDCLKNVDSVYTNYDLNWAAYIAGKRESRRLMGDIVLTKEILQNKVLYPDGCIATGWNMDIHVPNVKYEKGFEGNAFISHDIQDKYPRPFLIPYRTLYSRNINNLFMAGRNISVTHEVLGTVRVMKTGGMMGEVIGMAASICKKHRTTPRNVYKNHLEELKDNLSTGIK